MKNLNPVMNKIPKEYRQLSVQDSSKLLADFFKGVVIKIDDVYIYD